MKRATPDKRLEALAVAYLCFAVDHPAHYRIMFGRRLNEDGRFDVLEELVERAYGLLAGELRSGQAAGRFADFPAREAVFAFWSLTHGFASLALVRRIQVRRALLEDYTRQLLAPLLAGLRK
ncbi:MAG: WHG domain-containing protein [Myxococcales bacterium]|nr:WHG domain-containing protein [Myxococcales bacterium]